MAVTAGIGALFGTGRWVTHHWIRYVPPTEASQGRGDVRALWCSDRRFCTIRQCIAPIERCRRRHQGNGGGSWHSTRSVARFGSWFGPWLGSMSAATERTLPCSCTGRDFSE